MLKLTLVMIAVMLPTFALGFEVDPAYSAIAEATGGKVYKTTPQELNDPQKANAILGDILKDAGVQPGHGVVDFYAFRLVAFQHGVHGGYFPLKTPQPAGSEAIAEAVLFGDISNVEFTLIDAANQKIADIALSKNFPQGSGDYMGKFIMPAKPFRVMAKGTTADGKAFERYSSELILPAP